MGYAYQKKKIDNSLRNIQLKYDLVSLFIC